MEAINTFLPHFLIYGSPWLLRTLQTFFGEKITKICQAFTFTPTLTLHIYDSFTCTDFQSSNGKDPVVILPNDHWISFYNAPDHLFRLSHLHQHYYQPLHHIWSCTNAVQKNQGYSHPKEAFGFLRHQQLSTGMSCRFSFYKRTVSLFLMISWS